MTKETPYINPNLLLASSFASLIEDYKKYGHYVSLAHKDKRVLPEDLLDHQLLFVVAEPGQGKTRLLKELEKQAAAGKQKVLVDLKVRGRDETISSLIMSISPHWDAKNDALVLLDGLDEIPASDILYAIRHIRTYLQGHPNHQVIVASRLHYFSKFEAQFSDLSTARYVLIEPLALFQAKEFLKSLGISEAKVETVVTSLKLRRDDPLVIQNPRYLEFLAAFITDNPEVVDDINRAIIFDNFVDKALEEEDKNGTSLKAIKRKFLERLALTMEIARVNAVSEKDFIVFLDTAKSDAKLALMTQASVDDLYVHSLLKKDEGMVSFDNAEIQEYLAANAMAGFKDRRHVVFDLAIEPNLRELYPSWINTMSFLIDECPELLPELASLKDSPDSVAIDDAWHRLLTSSTSSKLSEQYKRYIFERVRDYYFDRNLRIDDSITFNLANYALDDHVAALVDDLLTQADDEAKKIKLVNVLKLTSHLAGLNKLSDAQLEKSKAKFVDTALNAEESHIKYAAIDGLGEFRDVAVLEKLLPLTSSTDSHIHDGLQGLSITLDRNHPDAIKIFTAGTTNRKSHYGRYGLLGVDSVSGINLALEAIASNKAVLFSLIEHDRLFDDEEESFLGRVSKNWQASWLPTLKQIVAQSLEEDAGYYATRSAFIKQSVRTIGSKDASYFEEFVKLAADKRRFVIDDMNEVAASIMGDSDAKKLAELIAAEPEDHLKWYLFSILRALPTTDNPKKEVIELEARKLLPDMYKTYDGHVAAEKKKKPKEDPYYLELQQRIINAKNGSLNDLLKGIEILENDNRTELLGKVDDADLQELWALAKKEFLDKFDPADTNVTITHQDKEGAKSYTISRYTPIFALTIKYATKTKRTDVVQYRKKLLSLIPFAYSDDLQAIFDTVNSINAEEGKLILDAYSDLSTDKARFMPSNLIEASEKYSLKEATPILDQFVDGEFGHIWDKEKALELSESLSPSIQRLRSVFTQQLGDQPALAHKANALLISKHADVDALKWRMDYLKNNAFEHVEQMEVHSVGANESELHDGKKTAPLKDIADPKHIDLYLDLLGAGLELIAKGLTWHNYAYYLWQVVDKYFTNIIIGGNYEPLRQLENYVGAYKDKVAAAQYIRHLNSIKQEYLSSLGKPGSFADAVNKHNKLGEKAYSPVTSQWELSDQIYTVLDKDWRAWVTDEGRKFAAEKQEQRRIYIELQNILMRKFGTDTPTLVLREAEALDDTATDFLIYYGFYGPVIIELKRSSHGDLSGNSLEQKKSYKSLVGYMAKFQAEYGILLIYDDQNLDNEKWEKFLLEVKNAYEKIKQVRVIGVQVPKSKSKKVNQAGSSLQSSP